VKVNEYSVGDVVQLKSGGPLMTVHSIGDYSPTGPNPGLHCIWFDKATKNEDVFDPRAVELYRE
jgi:uncharacterized protein YodC (DUF2158 family)